MGQKGGLADPGGSLNQQRTAALGESVDQFVDSRQLLVPTEQYGARHPMFPCAGVLTWTGAVYVRAENTGVR